MKKVIALIVAMFALSAHAQEITVFYKEMRKADYHSLRSSEWEVEHYVEKEVRDLVRDKAKTHEKELSLFEYISVLRINGDTSIHYPQNEITNDTINNSIKYGENGETFISREVSKKDYAITYMNINAKEKTSTDRYSGKDYLVSEKLQEYDWEITNEKKVIGKYRCQKAILKHEHDDSEIQVDEHEHIHLTEAWFTKDIQSSHGPIGYWGLPGLILEIREGSTYILLDKVVFDIGSFKVEPPTKGKRVSREGFKRLPILEFMEN